MTLLSGQSMAPQRLDTHGGGIGVDPLDESCGEEVGDPCDWGDPRRNHTAIAYTDNDSAAVVDQAVETLTILRAPMALGDAGATVSVLVSLAVEADGQLWDAVADARDQGYTWDEIAGRLATSAATARRRYSAYANWRRTQPLNDVADQESTQGRAR